MASVIGGILSGVAIGMAIVVVALLIGGDGEPEAVSPATDAPTVLPNGLPRIEDETQQALPPFRHDG
jgi:hypothetical protein